MGSKKRQRVIHTVRSPKIPRPMTFAVAADLHAQPFDDVMDDFRAADAVLVPGDLVNRHRRNYAEAARFLREVPDAAPVFYSPGNHEVLFKAREEWDRLVRESRVTLLDNESAVFGGIRIGGLSSRVGGIPDADFLDRYERAPEFKLLMCHQPEMWRDYVKGREIDFTVCGHAHGGQVEICGQGLYAPGQGLFPKLTHGVHGDGKMIISRGMSNSARAPRINNPCELILLRLEPGDDEQREEKPYGKGRH